MLTNIQYVKDQDKGNRLETQVFNLNWIEFLQQHGKVYYCKHPQPVLYQLWHKELRNHILRLLPENAVDNLDALGLVNSLAKERLKQPFWLPPLCSVEKETQIIKVGTGTSRLSAEFICGTPPEELSCIVFDQYNTGVIGFNYCEEITSMDQFEQLYSLAGIDYAIVMEQIQNEAITFKNSILRYTVYDYSAKQNSFSNGTNDIKNFWNKIPRDSDGKIPVAVTCTKETQDLIKADSSVFALHFHDEPKDEWGWSWGRIMGQFTDKNSVDQLKLWVFDITEPLHLEFFIPWVDPVHSTYYTLNQKAILFNPNNKTPMLQIGNFVK